MSWRLAPALRLWRPRIQVKLSTSCQIFWLKSKPRLWVPSSGDPKLATPLTMTAGPTPAPSLAVRNWCRRANCSRSSFRRSEPKDETSWTAAESMRSLKSVARSRVLRSPPMLNGEWFLKKK